MEGRAPSRPIFLTVGGESSGHDGACPSNSAMPTTSFNQFGDNQQIGGFAILDKIGEGGMGAVYRAQQISLERIVALKLLSPKLASDPKYTDSFLREARSAARLQHANIVAVFDAGKVDEFYYYAMEFIHGESLQKWVARDGALPEPLALNVALCVADALRHAWVTEHLIHRDIKPDNILVDTHGNVKVCDLGLAKYFGETTLISLSGQVYGTPQYMSPEQARAQHVDCRTDIYALGLVLYHALTGQIPFHGGTPAEVMARQLYEQLDDPRDTVPQISVHTVRILEKMVSKDTAQRYENWSDVLRDLRLAKENKPPPIPLIFHGKSSVKRNGGIQRSEVGGQRSNLAVPLNPDGMTWEQPLPQPRVKQPVEGRAPSRPQPQSVGGTGVPPVDQHMVSSFSPPPSKKSRAPLYIAGGVGVLLVLLISTFFALSSQNQKPPPPPPPNPAAVQLAELKTFYQSNSKAYNLVIARCNNFIRQFPNSAEAQEAAQLRDAALLAKRNDPPPPISLAARALLAANQFADANRANPDQWQNIAAQYRQVAQQFAGASEAQTAALRAKEWEDKWQTETDRRHKEAEEKRKQEEAARLAAEQPERERKEAESRAKAFTDFQTQLLDHLKNRRYADAEKLAADKLDDASLKDFHTVIAAWRDAVQRAGKFWSAFPDEVKKKKGTRVTLQGIEGDISEVTADEMSLGVMMTIGNRTEFRPRGTFEFAKLTTDSVLALLDLLNASGQLLADAAWFCFAEQKFELALKRVDDADRAKMTQLESDSREIIKQQRIAQLLATAKANDNKQNGKTFALPALAELLQLDPQHDEARKLYAKIAAYYGPAAGERWQNSMGMWFYPVQGTDVLFCVWETRVQDYEAFCKATGRQWEKPSFKQEPTHPAVLVSWNDAKDFCKWLTKREQDRGTITQNQEYRLPTEKEWSVAVGPTKYPWGENFPPTGKAGNYADESVKRVFPNFSIINGYNDGYATTAPVGQFDANRFGLYDMGGNVWEWCDDASGSSRVLRGASWYYDFPDYLVSSYRNYYAPSLRSYGVGFRCVLVVR